MTIKELRGVSDLVYAEVISDNDSAISFGTVKKLAGVAQLEKEVETSSETHYYDNQPAVVINSTGADKLTISCSALDDITLADITGQKYDTAKKMLVEGPREQKYFAIGYRTKDTSGHIKYVWRYKGTFEVPNESYKTEDDGTDANGQELVYTGIATTHKFTSSSDCAKAIAVDSVDAGSSFFNTVMTPDTFTPVVTSYTITYSGNGNTAGTVPTAESVNAGQAYTVKPGTGLVKDSASFTGWNEEADGTGTAHAAGSSFTPTKNTTLYAQFA